MAPIIEEVMNAISDYKSRNSIPPRSIKVTPSLLRDLFKMKDEAQTPIVYLEDPTKVDAKKFFLGMEIIEDEAIKSWELAK